MTDFTIKNWPLGNDKGYLQLVNPEVLYDVGEKAGEGRQEGQCPVSVVSYRDETTDSLEKIKEGTVNALEKFVEKKKPSKIRCFIPALTPIAIIDALTIPGIINAFVNPFVDLNSVYTASAAAITGSIGSIGLGGVIYSESKNNHEKLKSGIREFVGTPVSSFSSEKSEQLQYIAKSIDSNSQPAFMAMVSKEDYSEIKRLLKDTNNSIAPNTKTVYTKMKKEYTRLI
jgi:hypothetical protein